MALNLSLAYVILSIFHALALLLTVFRVSFRLWIGRFWWEDAWASVAIIFGIFAFVSLYTHATDNPTVVFASGWIFMYSWPAIVWSVRLSLLASVTRIVQPGLLRLFTLAAGWFFVAAYFALAAQKTRLCVSILQQFRHGLRSSYVCWADEGVAISEVTADIIADAILVVLPLRVLWGVRLERRQRRMIMAIFLSSAFVTVLSILHSVAEVIGGTAPWQGMATMMEIIVSLVVCNLLVIITLIYRTFIKEPTRVPQTRTVTSIGVDTGSDSDDDDDFTQPRTRPNAGRTTRTTDSESGAWTRFLTTVELSISSSWRTVSEASASQKEQP